MVPGGGRGGPGGGPGGGMWGQTGIGRMFDAEQGGQISWLIPAALIVLVAALVVIGRAPRSDRRRAFLLLFAGWLVTMAGTFSFMAGIFHSYYTAALAPPIAAVLAGSLGVLWPERNRIRVRVVLAAATWAAAGWGCVLLARSPEFVGWLRWAVLVVGVVAGGLLLIAPGARWTRRVAGAAVAAAVVAGLAGPTAYTIDTVTTAKQGSIISAGPRVDGAMGGFGPGGPGPVRGLRGMPSMGQLPRGMVPGMPPGAAFPGGRGEVFGGMGAPGGLLTGSKPSDEITAILRSDADEYTWIAAAVGSNEASGYQIATGYSVMPIGGFNGTDPSPTLAEFKRLVGEGKVHYFIGGGPGFGGFGGRSTGTSSQIRDWVESTFPSRTVDGVTLYDLTAE